MSRRNYEGVTAEMAVLPDQAVDINPGEVAGEFNRFLDHPNTFAFESLTKRLVKEAYPDYPQAPQYFDHGMIGGRQVEDEVSRFPIFPLSKMQDLDKVLVDLVYDWSFPTGKYSFGPQNKIHEVIARSDSEYAHRALVEHVITPFSTEHQSAWDGPNEMEYKTRLVSELYSAATYHGTPELNPLAAQSLVEIYKAIRPGGFFYELIREDEQSDIDKGILTRKMYGPTLASLRELREYMFEGFLAYPSPLFNEQVDLTLDTEPNDPKRVMTVLRTLVNGRLRKRDDGRYGEVAEQVFASYDREAGELLKAYVENRFDRSRSSDGRSTDIMRQLTRRLISTELAISLADDTTTYSSSPILAFAIKNHPLSYTDLERKANNKFEWERSSNYYEDLSFLIGLVKGKNLDGVSSLAAWRISGSFENDYSYTDKPQRAKAAYMALAEAALSADPEDYPALIESNLAQSVMGAMASILHRSPLSMDKMTAADIDKIMAYREAYESYVKLKYPNNPSEPPEGDHEARQAWIDYTALNGDFRRMSDQFNERLEWREIQTNPRRYVQWMATSIANYGARFDWHVSREGAHARGEQRRFNALVANQVLHAKTLTETELTDDELHEETIRMVAAVVATYSDFMRSDLRYDNEFYHEYSSLSLSLSGNLPERLRIKALGMIEAGEVTDFMRKEDKEDVKRLVRRQATKQK